MNRNFKKLLVLPITLLLASCNIVEPLSVVPDRESTPIISVSEETANSSVETVSSSDPVTSETPATTETTTETPVTSQVPVSSEAPVSSETTVIIDDGRQYDTADQKVFIEELEVGDITEDVTNDIYTFVKNGDGKKTLTVAECNAEFEGETYNKLLKTQSASVTNADKLSRVISFTATGKGSVKIIAKSANEEERAIGLYNKENACEHDSKKVGAEISEIELTFHYAGTYYITSAANVSIYFIETSWEDGVNEDWAPEIKLSDDNVLLVSEIPNGEYKKATDIGNFTLNPGKTEKDGKEVEGKLTVEANSKSYDGVSYTSRLKLNALGSRDYSSIVVHIKQESVIHVIAMSGNSSTNSKVKLVKLGATAEEDVLIGDGDLGGAALAELTFPCEAGDYAFYAFEGKPTNIYSIYIEA